MSEIVTKRLTLRPMAKDDFDFLHHMWTEPQFCEAMAVAPMSEETVWMRLLRDIGHWQVVGYGNWLVRLLDGTPIGSMGIFDYRRDMEPPLMVPEVGWGLDPKYHGHGYGFEALMAALDYADRVLKAAKTAAIIAPNNAPSMALASKGGFCDVGECQFHKKPVRLFERLNPYA